MLPFPAHLRFMHATCGTMTSAIREALLQINVIALTDHRSRGRTTRRETAGRER